MKTLRPLLRIFRSSLRTTVTKCTKKFNNPNTPPMTKNKGIRGSAGHLLNVNEPKTFFDPIKIFENREKIERLEIIRT